MYKFPGTNNANRNVKWGGVVTPSSLYTGSYYPTTSKAKFKDKCEQRLEELRQASIP